MALGVYISVPFCRSKCSYCNFASGVFPSALANGYLDRLCFDLQHSTGIPSKARFDRAVDSIYVGGGTPTLLDIGQLRRLFVTISQNFQVLPQAEITVECAPGTLNDAMIDCLRQCGVNRVSLGVQSLVDSEAAAVGRLHKREIVFKEIAALRAAGIENINVDLIAGLPHQNFESWQLSLTEVIASGVPHVSVYMLEIDEDSRLGRELIAGGTRYHAHFVPDEDLMADLYLMACERLQAAGVAQYEISNFAREDCRSLHNLKYWTRQPYLGFGVDAHSMLPVGAPRREEGIDSIRIASPDSLEAYLAGGQRMVAQITHQAAVEESLFLGLRLTQGIDLRSIAAAFGGEALSQFQSAIGSFVEAGLLERQGDRLRLTSRGRLLSNEVFAAFVAEPQVPHPTETEV